jgi:hypothetical protein
MTEQPPEHEDGRIAAVPEDICVLSARGASAESCLPWRWSPLRQRGTSHLVSEHSQTSPFRITELQASPAQMRPQHSVLFSQERDDAVLLTHEPTAQSRDEQLGRRHCGILRHPTFDPVLGQYELREPPESSDTGLRRDATHSCNRPNQPVIAAPQINRAVIMSVRTRAQRGQWGRHQDIRSAS